MTTTLWVVALAGIAMPIFWLGPLLAIVLSIQLGWLPVSGSGTAAHFVLPAVTLGAALAAMLARMTRATLVDELRELYVVAARARGLSGESLAMASRSESTVWAPAGTHEQVHATTANHATRVRIQLPAEKETAGRRSGDRSYRRDGEGGPRGAAGARGGP